jgi:DNA-binding CsgD family transcriptional regulator/N-acetylneuraminic acid mutarotase
MQDKSSSLSDREKEILRLVSTGASNKEIASKLHISLNTVKVHIRNIFTKINVSSRTEAAMYALREGIIPSQGTGQLAEPSNKTESSTQTGRLDWKLVTAFLVPVLLLFIATLFLLLRDQLGINRVETNPPTIIADSRWEELEPMLTERFGAAAAVIDNAVFTFGGSSKHGVTGKVESYRFEENKWIKKTSKPTPVEDIQAVLIANKIYIPGGVQSDGEVSNKLEIYDPVSDEWEEKTSMPEPASAYALAAYEGKMYLFGGFDGVNFLDIVLEYNPESDQWTYKTPIPSPRGYAGAVVASGKIHLMGGYNGETSSNANVIYDPNLDNGDNSPWSTGLPLPESRYSMGITNLADNVYLIGGNNKGEESTSSLIYLISRDEWQILENPYDNNWTKLSLVSYGTNIYTLGGKVKEQPVKDVWTYQVIFLSVLPLVK